jgi:hypothetical protein
MASGEDQEWDKAVENQVMEHKEEVEVNLSLSNVDHEKMILEAKKMKYEKEKKKFEDAKMKAMQQSVCAGCVRPRVCDYCNVACDNFSFTGRGCGLGVPKVLPCCTMCGHDVVPMIYSCRDCVLGYSVDASGICKRCGRRPEDGMEEDVEFVPETEEN